MTTLVKNIRRQAGAEIRGAIGKGKGAGGESPVSGLEDAKVRYEHLVNSVHGLTKDIRSMVSSELGIATKQHDLEIKVKQIAQILNRAGDTKALDAEVVPTFVAGGNSLSSHVQAIQTGFLPHLDKIMERHKALSKDIADNKQKKVDYDHYAHKIQGLEEKARSKGNPKDFEHLESNKQKLQGALEAFESSSTELMKLLQNATQEISMELGLGLSSLAQANGRMLSAEGEANARLRERAPAWLDSAPPPAVGSGGGAPPGKPSKPNLLGMFKSTKESKQAGGTGQPLPALAAPPPPSDNPSASSGPLSYAELEAKLADCEARNDAGAEAYDKLRGELDSTLGKLQDAEQKQHAAEEQLAAVKAELQQARAGQPGSHAGEEVVELRRRLQEAEQHEQAYQIRLNSLERQLAEAKGTPVSYPPVVATTQQPLLDIGDVSNPFGPATVSAPMTKSTSTPDQMSSQEAWNPFG